MPLTAQSALALRQMIDSRRVKPSEVIAAHLARIAAVNGQINAVVSLRDPEAIMAEARRLDELPPQGALFGLPLAVKDLLATKGLRTTYGSPLYADHIPEADDFLVARMRAAGAVIIGKTNTPEWGHGSQSYNPVHGATRNPYELSRTAGGSSGGAAAALAAHMLPLADGSDMMGSLRNPAAFCNIYGLRPSYGLVSSDAGGETFIGTLATEGPMARSPQDLAFFLDILAGPNPQVPFATAKQDYLAAVKAAPPHLRGKRIAWLGAWDLPFEPGILQACTQGLRVLEDLGAEIIELAAPFDMRALWQAWLTLRGFLNFGAKRGDWLDPARRALLKPETQWEIASGEHISAEALYAASTIRSQWYAKAHDLLAQYDAFVMPSAQVWPFDVNQPWPKAIGAQPMDSYHRWMQVVVPVSLIGLPAVNVPVGFGTTGLPMGMQIATRHGTDAQLLQIAEAYHQATLWPQSHPPAL